MRMISVAFAGALWCVNPADARADEGVSSPSQTLQVLTVAASSSGASPDSEFQAGLRQARLGVCVVLAGYGIAVTGFSMGMVDTGAASALLTLGGAVMVTGSVMNGAGLKRSARVVRDTSDVERALYSEFGGPIVVSSILLPLFFPFTVAPQALIRRQLQDDYSW